MAVENKNLIYKKQIASLAFIASLTFKLIMLPKFLSESIGRDAWIFIATITLFEFLIFGLILATLKRNSFSELFGDSKLKFILAPTLALTSLIKLLCLSAESFEFISVNLFEQGGYLAIAFSLILISGYLAFKGGNILARTGQFAFWIILAGLMFTIVFFKAPIEFENLLPVFEKGFGNIAKGGTKHLLWFGDFTPFLFFSVKKNTTKKDFTLIATLIGLYASVVGFYLIMTSIYDSFGGLAPFAITRFALFNRISTTFSGLDFPMIICIIFMIVLKLALMFFAFTESCVMITKKRGITVLVGGVLCFFITIFAFKKISNSYLFATSWVGYLVGAIEYAIPIFVFGYSEVKYAKNNKK